MKRYIKINPEFFIVDIFPELRTEKFDGTEIYLDDWGSDCHLNGKCITDSMGVPMFQYINNTVIENYPESKRIESEEKILNSYRGIKITEIKQKANEVIIARYPDWKQTNMIADRQNALGVIAKLKSISTDAVQNELVDKLMGKNSNQLKAVRTDFTTLNIDSLVQDIPDDWKQEARNQYKVIGLSYIAWYLANKVRKWSDGKEIQVNEATDKIQVGNISLEDCPEI